MMKLQARRFRALRRKRNNYDISQTGNSFYVRTGFTKELPSLNGLHTLRKKNKSLYTH